MMGVRGARIVVLVAFLLGASACASEVVTQEADRGAPLRGALGAPLPEVADAAVRPGLVRRPGPPRQRVAVPGGPFDHDDRRVATPDALPPPDDGQFTASVSVVSPDVLARSTWQPGCPVTPDELRHVVVAHHGFDGRVHTGELLVHREVAEDVVEAFRVMFETGFPVEQVRISSQADLEAPPTGDGNTTEGFVCRRSVSTSRWSEHAFGRAVDVNPFHNPYVKDETVIPELATSYVDRDDRRAGMLFSGGPVVSAFEEAGWIWGGTWSSALDYMHFSPSGW